MEQVYNSATAAAAGLRAELKAAFPGIKFSVRTSYFSGGNSIDISWNFGPTVDAVRAISHKYQYGRFDGMTDSSWTEDTVVSLPSGEVKTLGGAKFVHEDRDFRTSPKDWKSASDFLEKVQREICALSGVEYKGRETIVFGQADWDRQGEVGSVVYRLLARTDLSLGYGCIIQVNKEELGWEESLTILTAAEAEARAKASAEEVQTSSVTEVPEESPDMERSFDTVAEEIASFYGAPLRRMSLQAIKSAVDARCYLRHPDIDRDAVLRSILAKLNSEVSV